MGGDNGGGGVKAREQRLVEELAAQASLAFNKAVWCRFPSAVCIAAVTGVGGSRGSQWVRVDVHSNPILRRSALARDLGLSVHFQRAQI